MNPIAPAPALARARYTASFCSSALTLTIFCVLTWTGTFTYGAIR